MPTRSRTTFQKRQKELLRMEKQREKAARRQQRKLGVKETGDPDTVQVDDSGTPETSSPATE
ncbi:MAG TPA: hypothetical protein VE959_11875 [Bryobacteraceae bacterium]|nr:hypothetical protein [Bryobacteraceae bacterium]